MSEQHETTGAAMAGMAARCTSCGKCVRLCNFLQKQGTPASIAEKGATAVNLCAAYGCSLCRLCDAVCPESLSPAAMFLRMRQQAVATGQVDLKTYSPWLSYEQLGSSFLFRRYDIPSGCQTVFFPGCSLSGMRPDTVLWLSKRLRQHDLSIGLVLDCCGKISHDLGLESRFDSLFRALQQRLRKQGITRILTACPGCSNMLKRHGYGFDVQSVYERLADGPTENAALLRGTVAVHDPCPSRFDQSQRMAVRRLLEQRGYQVEELTSSGVTTRCCGQGGMVEGAVPGTVKEESSVIATEAAGRMVVSYCASCCDTLYAVMPISHIADLMAGDKRLPAIHKSSLQRWISRLKLRWIKL